MTRNARLHSQVIDGIVALVEQAPQAITTIIDKATSSGPRRTTYKSPKPNASVRPSKTDLGLGTFLP